MFYGRHHDLVNRNRMSVSQMTMNMLVPFVVVNSKCNHNSGLSSFMTSHRFLARVTRHVPLVEQELPTLPDQLSSSSPSVLRRVHVVSYMSSRFKFSEVIVKTIFDLSLLSVFSSPCQRQCELLP